MGSGSWDASSYAATRSYMRSTGTDPFGYTKRMASVSHSDRKVHELLDPKGLNTAGEKIRECLDSDEHPNATPIAVMFDETGSMSDIPRRLVEKLENLFGLLLRKGYCEDPQILVGGIGDAAWREIAPLQVSQFESDNRIDEALRAIYLEGNGGGGGEESYELAMWFLANFVRLDSLDKRGKKGYLFIIGDETYRPALNPVEVRKYVGEEIDEPISFEQIVSKLKETWEVFWIYPTEAHYYTTRPDYLKRWKDVFGQNVLVVDDIDNVCETIGTAVGLMEGAIDGLDDALDDLDEIGAGGAKGTVSKALATVASGGGGAIAVADVPDGLDGEGTDRL